MDYDKHDPPACPGFDYRPLDQKQSKKAPSAPGLPRTDAWCRFCVQYAAASQPAHHPVDADLTGTAAFQPIWCRRIICALNARGYLH